MDEQKARERRTRCGVWNQRYVQRREVKRFGGGEMALALDAHQRDAHQLCVVHVGGVDDATVQNRPDAAQQDVHGGGRECGCGFRIDSVDPVSVNWR